MGTKTEKKSKARLFLERLSGGSLTFGEALLAVREREGLTQVELAERICISRSHLCDLEKGRKLVSPGLAAEYARILRHSESQFVRLALQDQVVKAGLKLIVRVDAA